ncbi:hypothetical protein DL768_011338 [Monosporascus sp. mg162]|nr:hypothetical protein DL768_011338 [Monosporascus sp. mg162]
MRLAAERAPADAAAVAAAAADAAAAAAAADAVRVEAERVEREQATAAAEEPRAPETPARPPRSRSARGKCRAVPCLGCLRSALAGCSTGECFDAAVGSRCWRCAFSFANVRPFVVRLVKVFENEALRRDIDRLRASIRVLLKEKGGGEEEQAAPAGNPAAVRVQVLALVGQILDLLLL